MNARFSRAHSRTLSAEGSSAAAARSIKSGPACLDCLGTDVLYEPAGENRSPHRLAEMFFNREPVITENSIRVTFTHVLT